MITEALGTPAPLLSSLLIPISLFKYNLVFTWFMDSVPVTELHSAWAAYWFSITAAQKNKEMTAALGCRPRAGGERQELIISGVITQAVPGRTVTLGAQPTTQWLSASDTMSSPDRSAWVLIPASSWYESSFLTSKEGALTEFPRLVRGRLYHMEQQEVPWPVQQGSGSKGGAAAQI